LSILGYFKTDLEDWMAHDASVIPTGPEEGDVWIRPHEERPQDWFVLFAIISLAVVPLLTIGAVFLLWRRKQRLWQSANRTAGTELLAELRRRGLVS
jgi:hypothetical protein